VFGIFLDKDEIAQGAAPIEAVDDVLFSESPFHDGRNNQKNRE
jgi:hypothetical protein